MKKVIFRISVIIFIIGVSSIIGGFAASERVRPLVKQVANEMAVSNNIVKFVEENMEILNINESDIRGTVNSIDFIENVVEYYVDATMLGLKNSSFKKTDIAPYLDKTGVTHEISGVIKKIVYAIIEHINAEPDFKDKLIINQAISFGASKITDMITKEINKNIKDINLRIKLQVKLYYLINNFTAKIILIVITAVSFILLLTLAEKEKYFLRIGRIITIAGGCSIIILIYNIIRCSYKIKNFLGFTLPLGLEKYMIISGAVLIVGLLVMIPGIILKKGDCN